jgi:hypothetical protein
LLLDLQKRLLAQHPDVICGEITPEAYNAPMEGNFDRPNIAVTDKTDNPPKTRLSG